MASRIITDISDFIFVEDTPEPADAIFLPGGTHAEQPEYAAALYRQGYGKWLIPSGGVSVKKERWPGVSSKADVYTGDYHTDCAFFYRRAAQKRRARQRHCGRVPIGPHPG